MAAVVEVPNTLGDLFAKKKKKNFKGSNLNNETTKVVDEKKIKPTKEKDEEGWEEEQIVGTQLKVEVAGKLVKEDDKKDEDDQFAPAWSSKVVSSQNGLDGRKYPTLERSMVGKNTVEKVETTFKTSKNAFEALNDDFDEKKPKERSGVITKQKGESQHDANKREADRRAELHRRRRKEEGGEDSEDEPAPVKVEKPVEKKPVPEEKKKETKKVVKKVVEEEEDEKPQEEVQEDLLIQPDQQASRNKYIGRAKLPMFVLPESEMREKSKAPLSKKKIYTELETKKENVTILEA